MKTYVMKIKKLPDDSSVLITVKITKEFKLRILIAKWLFILASKILGANVSISITEKDGSDPETVFMAKKPSGIL